jgi:protein arginine N-methyltransferase 1
MIKNLLDLKSRALKPSGRIVPGAFEFFIEPVTLKKEYGVPHMWEFKDLGFELEFLKDSPLLEQHKRRDYGLFRIQAHFVDFLLCEPEALIEFDINTIASPAEIGQSFEVARTVVREGVLDGFCIYFRAKFDAQTVIDSSPIRPQTHWENLVIRTERRPYMAGERIAYTVELPSPTSAISWKVSLLSSQ